MSRGNDLAGRRVLVTGASGLLGRRTVAALADKGCIVHALVRKTSQTSRLLLPNVTIFRGDVAEAESMRPAFAGADYVIHAAADTTGNEEKGKSVTIGGTQNVLALCNEFKVKKLVYISSCSVYGIADCAEGRVIDENAPLERFPEKRGQYSLAKFRAEQLVAQAIAEERFPIVCLRPGTYFGPGCDIFTPMMGFSAGRKLFAIIGAGTFVLPLVNVENLVDAIVTTLPRSESTGKVYNVVDADMPTKRQYVESFLKRLYPNAVFLFIPYSLFRGVVRLQELAFGLVRRDPFLTTYRLESSQKSVIYDASRLRKELGWSPSVTIEQAYAAMLEHERAAQGWRK